MEEIGELLMSGDDAGECPLPSRDEIPPSLLDHDHWVCWRTQNRDGKTTKIPVNPASGHFASTTNADTWGSFETAHSFASDGSADGVGFVFTEADSIVGVDLDDCRDPETEECEPWATTIIEALNSYTEVSPSGTGYHVLVEGSLTGERNRRDNVELYDDARFFTVTGDHVDGTPDTVEAHPDALKRIHEEHVARLSPESDGDSSSVGGSSSGATDNDGDRSTPVATWEKPGPNPDAVDLTDEELLTRAENASNGEKFRRLWRGDTTGYDSHSEADMALCAMLAFWTGGDPDRVDRLFRSSGLMREKWDERHFADGSTYGEKTVERAIEGTDEFYNPEHQKRRQSTEPVTEESVSRATIQSLSEEIETLEAREETHINVIERLEARVDELVEENEQLRAQLEAERERRREPQEDRTSETIWTRLVAAFGRRDG